MNLFKRLVSVFLISAIIICISSFTVLGAGTAEMGLSSDRIFVGENVQFVLTISPGEEMYAVEAYIKYDDSLFYFAADDSESYTATNGVIHIVNAIGGKDKETYTFNFTAISSGSGEFKAEDIVYCPANLNMSGAEEISLPDVSCSYKITNIFGDTNFDGVLNVKDLVHLKKQLANMIKDIKNADMDNNGLTEPADLIIIKQKLLGNVM